MWFLAHSVHTCFHLALHTPFSHHPPPLNLSPDPPRFLVPSTHFLTFTKDIFFKTLNLRKNISHLYEQYTNHNS